MQDSLRAPRRVLAEAHLSRAEAVVRIVPLDEENLSAALLFRDAQRVLRAAKEAEHHRVVGLFRRERLHIAADRGDAFYQVSFQRFDGQLVGVHRRDMAAVRLQSKAQLADAAARVADVRVFLELRRDLLREGLIIAVHRRRITQKRNALVRPLHAAFPFSHSTCFTGKPIPAQSTAFTQDIAAEYQYTFIESL